jgi:Tfp pilus assembly protein PilE
MKSVQIILVVIAALCSSSMAAMVEGDVSQANAALSEEESRFEESLESNVHRELSTSKSTKAPTIKSTKAPTIKSTKAPTIKSTKAPTIKSTKAPTIKSTKAPVVSKSRRLELSNDSEDGPNTLLNFSNKQDGDEEE